MAGTFGEWGGTVSIDTVNPANSRVNVTVQTASIDTRVEARDDHLRTPDFFAVDSFPTMTFRSTNVVVQDDQIRVLGDLTLRGVTRPVLLAGTYEGEFIDPWGGTRTGFSARTSISRKDFVGETLDLDLPVRGVLAEPFADAVEPALGEPAVVLPGLLGRLRADHRVGAAHPDLELDAVAPVLGQVAEQRAQPARGARRKVAAVGREGDHDVVPAPLDLALALGVLCRPGDAVPVLEAAIAHAPGDVNARLLLAYAWLEQERFDLAMPLFEALPAGQEAWPRRAGARSGYANWDRYSGDVTLAMARSHGHDNATAERTLAALGTIGPLNSGLQSTIGSVQSRRLRPTAALERFDMALTLDPEQRDARAGRVDALMALENFPGVSGDITYVGTDGTPANRVMGLYAYQFEGNDWVKATLRGISLD